MISSSGGNDYDTNNNNTRYQITLQAENLPNVRPSFFGKKSCPFAQIKVTTGPQKGTVLGQTECCPHDLSPEWTKILFVEFSEQDVTELEVTIWDHTHCHQHSHRGGGGGKVNSNDGDENKIERIVVGGRPNTKWMGEATFEATSVFQSPGKTQYKQIGRAENSRLYIHIEKSVKGPARGHFHLHLRGLDMKNVEPGLFGLGRSDPFFEVAKKDADYAVGQVKWNTVYRSEHIDNNLNPYWQPANIGLEELCYGDLEWPLKVSVCDHEQNGKHRLIGEFETTIGDLQSSKAIRGNADREKAILLCVEGKFKRYGLLCVLKAELSEEVLAE